MNTSTDGISTMYKWVDTAEALIFVCLSVTCSGHLSERPREFYPTYPFKRRGIARPRICFEPSELVKSHRSNWKAIKTKFPQHYIDTTKNHSMPWFPLNLHYSSYSIVKVVGIGLSAALASKYFLNFTPANCSSTLTKLPALPLPGLMFFNLKTSLNVAARLQPTNLAPKQ